LFPTTASSKIKQRKPVALASPSGDSIMAEDLAVFREASPNENDVEDGY
jgi:hypothetical protein